jgi:hypothetical protein
VIEIETLTEEKLQTPDVFIHFGKNENMKSPSGQETEQYNHNSGEESRIVIETKHKLTSDQIQRLENIVKNFKIVKGDKLDQTNVLQHHIDIYTLVHIFIHQL